jgi:REP element-mobilizing transposase RayT
MANTYAALHYHLVFSTKNRHSWIHQEHECRVWQYLGGILKNNKMIPLKVGGVEDPVHLLIGASPTLAPARIAQLIKGTSSAWIHDTFPEWKGFAWQDGYGAFTVSKSAIADISNYIANQRERHRTTTFQEEYRALLTRHVIVYDERYLWD